MFAIPFHPNSPLTFPLTIGRHSNVFVIIHLVETYCMHAYSVSVGRARNTYGTKTDEKQPCLPGAYIEVGNS